MRGTRGGGGAGDPRCVLETKFDFCYEDERNRCFGRVFACVHEGPFTLQAEEVE